MDIKRGIVMNELELLSAIKQNARMSIKDLALVLNEAESDVLDKLNELERAKVICGYHTVINYDKLNTEEVISLIQVGAIPQRETGYDEIAKKIYRYDEVNTMYLMSGKMEFVVIISGKTMREVSDFVARKLAVIDGVTKTETYFILKPYKVEGIIIEEKKEEDSRLLSKL